MKQARRWLSAAVVLCSVVTAARVAKADDQDVIDYRERIMKTLHEQSEAVGMILSGAVGGENMAAHLQIIAETAATALKAFEPKVPGGEAKPEVWRDWPDFSKRMNEFVLKTADVAKLAKQKKYDDPALANAILDGLSCKGCHDDYRDEKAKK